MRTSFRITWSLNNLLPTMKFLIVLLFHVVVTSGLAFNILKPISSGPSKPLPEQSHISDQADDKYDDSEYHYSWRHDGNQEYTGDQASVYCEDLGNGWHAISIETTRENNYVKSIIQESDISNIWTGAARAGFRWNWPNGGPFRSIGWPNTGVFRANRQPQPDNRDKWGRNCLAVMDYNGSINWEDVPCQNYKPVICERRL